MSSGIENYLDMRGMPKESRDRLSKQMKGPDENSDNKGTAYILNKFLVSVVSFRESLSGIHSVKSF